MKNLKTLKKGLLAIGFIALFTSCSTDDNQETSSALSELQSIGKEDLIGKE